jgi:hypothetical protein
MNAFFRYMGNHYVPGGIVEATGHVQNNPRSGWSAARVRFPVNGEFQYIWAEEGDLIPCAPVMGWPEAPVEPKPDYKEARGILVGLVDADGEEKLTNVYVALVRDASGVSILGVFTSRSEAYTVADSFAQELKPSRSLPNVLEFAINENTRIASFPNWRVVPEER